MKKFMLPSGLINIYRRMFKNCKYFNFVQPLGQYCFKIILFCENQDKKWHIRAWRSENLTKCSTDTTDWITSRLATTDRLDSKRASLSIGRAWRSEKLTKCSTENTECITSRSATTDRLDSKGASLSS